MTKRKLKLLLAKKSARTVLAVLCCCIILICAAIPCINSYRRFSVKETVPLSDIFIKKTDRFKINLTAYRGLSSQAPENTLPAIELSAKNGFRTVALDLRLTKDGIWVLSADKSVNAMTDGIGKISSYTYYDLITCKVNRGANCKNYDNLTLPSLEQALKTCLEFNVKPILNILDYSDSAMQSLTDIIASNGFSDSCYVMCSNKETLAKIKSINPKIQTIFYIDRLTSHATKEILESNHSEICIHASHNMHRDKNITKLIDNGVKIYCLGTNNAEQIQYYFELGIYDFMTDRIYKK